MSSRCLALSLSSSETLLEFSFSNLDVRSIVFINTLLHLEIGCCLHPKDAR